MDLDMVNQTAVDDVCTSRRHLPAIPCLGAATRVVSTEDSVI